MAVWCLMVLGWSGLAVAAPHGLVVHLTVSAPVTGAVVLLDGNQEQKSVEMRDDGVSPDVTAGDQIYAGTTAGAFRSGDNGGNWGLLGAPGDDLFGIDVTGFAITPGTPRTVFATTGGRGVWQYTEVPSTASVVSTTLSGLLPHSQLQKLPSMPNDTFVPIAPKSRSGNIC